MIQKNFKQTPVARWVSASLAVATFSGAVYAATPLAGTAIKNYATVTYTDASGIQRSVQSNEAVVTVAPVYFATIENDVAKTAAPGNTVYLSHTLVNTGNTPDTYQFAVTDNLNVYLDTDNNGQPSAGESPIPSSGLQVAPGESVSLVVEYQVPVTATNATAPKVIDLTVTSTKTGAKITDPDTGTVTSSSDPRTNQGTVTSTVKVSEGAVIVSNKSMAFDNKGTVDPSDDEIVYTLTAKNTGLQAAKNVVIVDAIPELLYQDGTKKAATVTSVSVKGLLGNDIVPTAAEDFDETVGPVDVNQDKQNDAAVKVIKAIDKDLPPNTEVSVTFAISLASTQSGQPIENTYLVYEADSTDPKGEQPKAGGIVPSPSNKVVYKVAPVYAVTVSDTGADKADGVNDGGDDDGAKDGTQTVNKAGAGAEVKYKFDVSNAGNGDDLFSLDVANTNFPSGTVFTFWNAEGTVQLTNIADTGAVDVGPVAQGTTRTVMVKAILPPGTYDGKDGNTAPYVAKLNVTSHGNSTKTSTIDLKLGAISKPTLDVALKTTTAGIGDSAVDADPASADPDAAKTQEAEVGGTAVFELQVVNEGTAPESFLLSEGADFPPGWQVQFTDMQGNLINSTPTLAPNGDPNDKHKFEFKALVKISDDADEAKGDSTRAGDKDTNGDSSTGNQDRDYIFNLKAEAASGAASADNIKVAVDVISSRELTITPNSAAQQTQAGGSVTYPYTISNTGNEPEEITIGVNSNWPSNLMVDTDGDGTPDKNISNIKPGDQITFIKTDGTPSSTPYTVTAGPKFVLQPGEKLLLENIIASPSNAPDGSIDVGTVTITKNDNSTVVAKTTTTIVPDQVRLTKTVALDLDCDGNGQKDGNSTFQAAQTTEVSPGDCVVWKINAVNAGTTAVKEVVITDNVPAFTTYHPNSLMECGADSTCASPSAHTTATHSNGLVTFPVSTDKILDPGESYTVMFTTKIDSDDPADQ